MQLFWILFSVLMTAGAGILYSAVLPIMALLSLLGVLYLLLRQRQQGFKPESDTCKALEKIKRKHQKADEKKHKHINDQIAYIEEAWGYTKEQSRIIERFIEMRAYSQTYNRLTASLFPQIITLIDSCNEQEQKGCKREVSRRLRELTDLMKVESRKQKSQKAESFETTLEVYDRLLLPHQLTYFNFERTRRSEM